MKDLSGTVDDLFMAISSQADKRKLRLNASNSKNFYYLRLSVYEIVSVNYDRKDGIIFKFSKIRGPIKRFGVDNFTMDMIRKTCYSNENEEKDVYECFISKNLCPKILKMWEESPTETMEFLAVYQPIFSK